MLKDVLRFYSQRLQSFKISLDIWSLDIILDIMMACVIIHNMIVEEELENNVQHVLEVNMGFQCGHGVAFGDLPTRTQEREDKDVC